MFNNSIFYVVDQRKGLVFFQTCEPCEAPHYEARLANVNPSSTLNKF